MGQEHLENLALLSIKNEEFGHINMDGAIDKIWITKPALIIQIDEMNCSSLVIF